MVQYLHCLDGCKHSWLLAPCLPHPVQSLRCLHHCQEGSHCVLDLLGGWMGSLLPWTSPVDCHECIRICSNCSHSITTYTFPATAYQASIGVAIANIVLTLALGWHVLSCSVDNCFTIFLPLFALAAPLANWALYRVGLNVLSYIGPAIMVSHQELP